MAREKDVKGKGKGGPSVIRPLEVAEVPVGTRVMTVYVPAFVVSGGVHLILVVVLLFTNLLKAPDLEAKMDDKITAAEVNDPEEKPEAELTNEDLGLDPELEASVDVEREEEQLVENVVTEDPIGIADATLMDASQTQAIGPALNLDAASGFTGLEAPDGVAAMGAGGGFGSFATAGMMGRSGATRDKLLKAGGGNSESEAAVAKGLTWLARMQIKDGSNKGYWQFDTADGKEHNYRVAATGMALLPFLAAGETHKSGKKYKDVVARGISWLADQVSLGGSVTKGRPGACYTQGIAAVALCEAVGMTKDPSLKQIATRAINFIVNVQAGDGSWGYGLSKSSEGDTSIVGWMVQALKSADIAEIRFDKAKVYKAVHGFLNKVQEDSGASYGYRTPGKSPSLTSVGLLCRQYLGWTPAHPALQQGVKTLSGFAKQLPATKPKTVNRVPINIYTFYYATQVIHFYDGPEWKAFNPRIRDSLIGWQNQSGDKNVSGSWAPAAGSIGSQCGRLGTTAMCLLTLEVYYRHLPLYKRSSAGGIVELDR